MNIKEIVDKIAKDGSLNTNEYSVADRIVDVNNSYLKHVELARQIGSLEPIRNINEVFSEFFSVGLGNNVFVRSVKDTSIQRVDFQPDGGDLYQRLEEDAKRKKNGWKECRCLR